MNNGFLSKILEECFGILNMLISLYCRYAVVYCLLVLFAYRDIFSFILFTWLYFVLYFNGIENLSHFKGPPI